MTSVAVGSDQILVSVNPHLETIALWSFSGHFLIHPKVKIDFSFPDSLCIALFVAL